MPEETKPEEPLFDLLIPPGVPRKIIAEIIEKYDVKLVERKQQYNFANMQGDEREILAFRGRREILAPAEKFMIQRLKDFIGEE